MVEKNTSSGPWVLVDLQRAQDRRWQASSEASPDFGAKNLATDIVEEVWQSTGVEAETLRGFSVRGDLGVDMMAFLGTNLTENARITIDSSPIVGGSPFSATFQGTGYDRLFWTIDTELPTGGLSITITDPTNPDGYIRIGRILIGRRIRLESLPTQEVTLQLKDFKDEIKTEGFSSIAISRAIAKTLRFSFRDLEVDSDPYRHLQRIFLTVRTSIKALWILDPSSPLSTYRYSMFAKLRSLPTECHKIYGKTSDMRRVDLDIELDESL